MLIVTAAGRLARDAETRKTQGGDSVTSFTVAVDTRNGRDKETAWLRCSLWGKRGESLAPYLRKGTSVTVSGELSFSEYEGKPQQNVNVQGVALQGGKSEQEGPSGNARGGGGGFDADTGELDDDIPFMSASIALERRVS